MLPAALLAIVVSLAVLGIGPDRDRSARTLLYATLTLLVLGFGVLAAWTVGLYLILVGATLGLLAPFRERPAVFWPVFVGTVAFALAHLGVAPFYCTATGGSPGVETVTRCTSLMGIPYTMAESETGAGGLPILVATAAAIGAALTTLAILQLRRSSHPTGP